MSALRSGILLILIGLLGIVPLTLAYTSPGSPTGYVNDFAGILSAEEKSALDGRLSAFAASTTNEISVVVVPDMGGDYIENYAARLFEEWGIGTERNSNGVLLLLALEERELRIEVGYGLEGALPDSVADRIIRNDMVPPLQDGDYAQALERGSFAIMAATQGEYAAEAPNIEASFDTYAPFLFGGFIFLQWLFAIIARSKSWWLGGIVGVLAGSIVSSIFGLWLMWGLFITLGLTLLGLVLDYFVSRAFSESVRTGTNPPWWTGGNSGGWGGGGRSGGGFGGFGGGRSGGGGASGRW